MTLLKNIYLFGLSIWLVIAIAFALIKIIQDVRTLLRENNVYIYCTALGILHSYSVIETILIHLKSFVVWMCIGIIWPLALALCIIILNFSPLGILLPSEDDNEQCEIEADS